jgi:hypothetical protein
MKTCVVFGDSFAKNFIPLLKFIYNFEIYTLKGTPMKGIVNKNDKYKEMVKILNANEYKYGIFTFGHIDLYQTYYYKKYHEKIDKPLDYIFSYAEDYVKIISELPNVKEKYIMGIMPHLIIKEQTYKEKLDVYFSELGMRNVKIDKLDIEIKFRNLMVIGFNLLLKKACKKYNIHYCGFENYIIINKKLETDQIFRIGHNKYNFHYTEYALILYLQTKLKFLLKYINDYDKFIMHVARLYNEYIKHGYIRTSEGKFNESNIDKFISDKKFDINKITKIINSRTKVKIDIKDYL